MRKLNHTPRAAMGFLDARRIRSFSAPLLRFFLLGGREFFCHPQIMTFAG
jgi:hypothetical protein